MVKRGDFREDLFYRLNVARLRVPPLRERPEDIPDLLAHIIEKLNLRMGKTIKQVDPDALKLLKSYSYPGNVRELENIIERAFIFSPSDTIEAAAIDIPTGSRPAFEPSTLKALERNAIEKALHRWEGNRTRAAEELGITRRTLLNKIKEYHFESET
jgi:two-component system response regulator AtoC